MTLDILIELADNIEISDEDFDKMLVRFNEAIKQNELDASRVKCGDEFLERKYTL